MDDRANLGAISIREFHRRFKKLLSQPVSTLSLEGRLAHAREYLRSLEVRDNPMDESVELRPSVEIVPFEPGYRPVDEALHPGQGCSERVGFVDTTRPDEARDQLWLLYQLKDLFAFVPPFDRDVSVRLSASFVSDDGDEAPVPGLQHVPIAPARIAPEAYPALSRADSAWADFHSTTYAVSLEPGRALLPRREGADGYRWEDLPASVRARTPDGRDPFTFANQFRQTVRLRIALHADGRTLGTDATDVEVFDTGRFGSLYVRLMETLLPADLARQAKSLGASELHVGYHPWFPVLTIGTDKAFLYLRAIHQDLDDNRKNLPDPSWLLRVGLYLELLTCLGIFEAVRGEHPDLLSAEERRAFETDPRFAEVRSRIDVAAWQKVWALREIVPNTTGALAAGPVSMRNLLRKQKATLAFLHAHHEDLKHAIALAGPNLNDSQETWHRVFRDAERAVLRNSLVAFPELGALSARQRDFALWHQRGRLEVFGSFALPESLTGLFGDQDGVYPSACRQYRASMNDVAKWARARTLMDYTGDECVPVGASLFEAYFDKHAGRLAALQRRDGYGPTLELADALPEAASYSPDEVAALLRRLAMFRAITNRETLRIATAARRHTFGPNDRVVIQGNKGSSLFVVAEGAVEVLTRTPDGADVPVALLDSGGVFGEFALLTGAERSATVRAVDDVILYEIDKSALQPIIEARPQLVVELAKLMAERQSLNAAAPTEQKEQPLSGRIRAFFFGR